MSVLWGNMAYCVDLSGEDLSCHSNKVESADMRKCPYYHDPTKKVMSHEQTFLRACPTSRRKYRRHRYSMKKLRHCHRVYRTQHTPLGQDVDAESKGARVCEEDDLLVEQWRKSVKVLLVRLQLVPVNLPTRRRSQYQRLSQPTYDAVIYIYSLFRNKCSQ